MGGAEPLVTFTLSSLQGVGDGDNRSSSSSSTEEVSVQSAPSGAPQHHPLHACCFWGAFSTWRHPVAPSFPLSPCCFSSYSSPRTRAVLRTMRRKPRSRLAGHGEELGMLEGAGHW